jgi:hypothetical protein
MKSPRTFRRRGRAIALLVLSVGLALGHGTVAAADSSALALRLEVVSQAEGESNGFWVLKRLPGPEDIAGPETTMKTDVQKAIASIRAADKENPQQWNLKKRDPANFETELRRNLPTYIVVAVRYPPPGPSGIAEITFTSKLTNGTAPPIVNKPIEISIIVRGSTAIARQPVRTTIGNLASHHVGNLGTLTPDEAQTKVLVTANPQTSPATASWADSNDHARAFAAAVFAFQSAKTHNLPANQPFGKESQETGALTGAEDVVRSEIEAYVNREFSLPGQWEVVAPEDRGLKLLETEFGPQPWRIQIALQAVEEVSFHIRNSQIDGNLEPVDKHPKWADDIAALERRVQANEKKRFDDLRGRLITAEEFNASAEEIRRDVRGEHNLVNPTVETGERSVMVAAEFLPRITDLEAGVGYSTDKQLSGSLSLTSRNLIKNDSLLKLSATVGLEKQEGEFSFALPWYISRDGRSSSTLDINVTYGKDNDLILGAPQFDGLDEERLAGSVRNTFRFTSERMLGDGTVAPDLRPSQVYALLVATSAGLSDTRLAAPPALRTQTESGQILFLLLDAQQSLRWKLRPRESPGWGETQLLWDVVAKKAFRAGPGDFDFFASNTSLTGKIYFGDKSSRDFIARLTIGGALVTGNSPLFEEFRIGGDTIVRGMEEGERTARGLFFDTLQFGVAVERLWPGGSAALGFDLKNLYLGLLFDHALITRQGSASPPPSGESRNFEAVGVSVEMALPGDKTAGSLEFGYAWSPQSIHEHGRVFTTVRFDF